MSGPEKIDRDELLLDAYANVPLRAPLIASEADRRLFARAWITSQTGEPFDDPGDRSVLLAGRVAGIVDASEDPARAQLVVDLADAEKAVADAAAFLASLDGPILEAQRVAAEFTADLGRAEEAERVAEAEATSATSSGAIRKAAEKCAKASSAVAQARKAAQLAAAKIAEARSRQAPAIAEADAAVRAAEAAVEGVRKAIRSVDVMHTWLLYQSAVRAEEERHAQVMEPLVSTKARLDAEARKLGLELEPPIPEPPPPPEYAVSVVWPAPAFQDRRPRLATDADLAVLAKYGIQVVKYDALLGNVNPGWSAAQVLGLERPPPLQPKAPPPPAHEYPARLSDEARDKLAAYIATGGDETSIVGDMTIDGSSPLFHQIIPPTRGEFFALAGLPRPRREDLPTGHADDRDTGWRSSGPILEALERALRPSGPIAMKRGARSVPKPVSGMSEVRAGHQPVDLDPAAGRAYRRQLEGKGAEPQRVVRLGSDNKPDDTVSVWGAR